MRTISLAAIDEAASAVYAAAVRTPLVRLDLPFPADEAARPEVYLKLECLQPIGSFKLRGAFNAVRQLSPAQLAGGVWTVSAGNAAQGVAFAAKVVGAPCSVMVIDTAPATKLRAIERLGATIVPASYDECWRTVESHRSDRMRGHFVHPFDDDTFIAGNATAGVEILAQLPDVDAVVAPIGGGGLLAGVAAVVSARRRSARIFAAEPETASPLALSLAAGEPRRFAAWQASFVDGAGGKSVLPTMWPLLQPHIDRIDRRVARPGCGGDETRRRTRARRHRRRRGVRGRCRSLGPDGPGQDRGDRLGRQHRSLPLRHAGRRLPLFDVSCCFVASFIPSG